jgi:hypothetical protein
MKLNFTAVLSIFILCLSGCKYIHSPFSKRIIKIKYDTVSTDESKEVAGQIKNRTDSINIGIYFTSPKSSAIIRTKNQCVTVNSVETPGDALNLPPLTMLPKSDSMPVTLEYDNGNVYDFNFDSRFWIADAEMYRDTLTITYVNHVRYVY